MDTLVSIASLVVLVASWWWLANRMEQSGRGWLLRNLAGGSLGCFLAVVTVSLALSLGLIEAKQKDVASSGAKPKTTQVVEEVSRSEPKVPQEKVVEKSLGLTPQQYAKRINPMLENFKKPYRLDPVKIEAGETVNILSSTLGPYASLISRVSKETGELLDVTLICSGDGTPQSGLEVMMIASATLAAVSPSAESKDVFVELKNMMDGQVLTLGNAKISSKSDSQLGTWFFATPI